MRVASMCAVAVLVVMTGSAFARGGGGGGFGAPGGMPGQAAPATNALGINTAFYTNEYDLLAAQVTLTDDQKTKVKARVDAMNKELSSLLQNADSIINSASAAGRGGRGGGATPPAPLTPEQVKVRDDYRFLADQHQVKINSELTDAQKIQWETYKLNTFLDPKLATLDLTDAQKEKAKGLVGETAKSLAMMNDARDIDTLEGKLIRRVMTEVLTEAQAARLFELPLGTNSGGRGAIPTAPAGRGGPGGRGGR